MRNIYALSMVGLCFLFRYAFAIDEPVRNLIESVYSCDAPSEEGGAAFPSSLSELCSAEIAETGMTAVEIYSNLMAVVTNVGVQASLATNENEFAYFSGAAWILDRYGNGRDYVQSLSYVMTNSPVSEVVLLSGYYYARADLGSCIRLCESGGLSGMPDGLRERAYAGVYNGFNSKESSETRTNEMICVAMSALPSVRMGWGQTDREICRWWPDYATSSNRYLAAQRALQIVPPPASSNYLNRVIAELEALPPGTMHLLPTNHLGTAWSE